MNTSTPNSSKHPLAKVISALVAVSGGTLFSAPSTSQSATVSITNPDSQKTNALEARVQQIQESLQQTSPSSFTARNAETGQLETFWWGNWHNWHNWHNGGWGGPRWHNWHNGGWAGPGWHNWVNL